MRVVVEWFSHVTGKLTYVLEGGYTLHSRRSPVTR